MEIIFANVVNVRVTISSVNAGQEISEIENFAMRAGVKISKNLYKYDK